MGGICVWLVGVVVRRYIDYIIFLLPTPLVSPLFCRNFLFNFKNVFGI